MISVDSPKLGPSALRALEDDAWGASREACASLEDGALAEDPPLDVKVGN